MEGSFDWDVLIGDGRANAMLGQPGADSFYGGGGDDVIDARDGGTRLLDPVRRQAPAAAPRRQAAAAPRHPGGRALTDPFDPCTALCAITKHGHPVDGLGNADEP